MAEGTTVLIVEKITCNTKCSKKYMDADGTFKGGKGKAFDNCVESFSKCCTGVSSPKALCATIGKKSGKIK